jgi:hypothetical protein
MKVSSKTPIIPISVSFHRLESQLRETCLRSFPSFSTFILLFPGFRCEKDWISHTILSSRFSSLFGRQTPHISQLHVPFFLIFTVTNTNLNHTFFLLFLLFSQETDGFLSQSLFFLFLSPSFSLVTVLFLVKLEKQCLRTNVSKRAHNVTAPHDALWFFLLVSLSFHWPLAAFRSLSQPFQAEKHTMNAFCNIFFNAHTMRDVCTPTFSLQERVVFRSLTHFQRFLPFPSPHRAIHEQTKILTKEFQKTWKRF